MSSRQQQYKCKKKTTTKYAKMCTKQFLYITIAVTRYVSTHLSININLKDF